MKLTVRKAPEAGVGNDIVYIHKYDRGSVKVNRVCKICVADACIYATVRGKKTAGEISIDKQLRLELDVELDQEYDFSIDYRFYYFLIAPFRTTNMGVRAAYIIAVASLLVSLLPFLFDFVFEE